MEEKLLKEGRRSPLVQGGLEVPCCIRLSGIKKLVYKALKNPSNDNLVLMIVTTVLYVSEMTSLIDYCFILF